MNQTAPAGQGMMRALLWVEELAQLFACLFLLVNAGMPWWVYIFLLFGPDVGALGYLAGPKIGALTYNVLHHKGVALAFIIFTAILDAGIGIGTLVGVILYGHSSLDRLFGFGLKYADNFKHTHLGWMGRASD